MSKGRKPNFYERRKKEHYPQVEKIVEKPKKTIEDVLKKYRLKEQV